jgi:hypothetical protein
MAIESGELMMRTLWSVLAALVKVPHHHGTAVADSSGGTGAGGGAAATALRLLGLGQQVMREPVVQWSHSASNMRPAYSGLSIKQAGNNSTNSSSHVHDVQKESVTLERELVQALKGLTSHHFSSSGGSRISGSVSAAAAAAAASDAISSWLQPVAAWSGAGHQQQQPHLHYGSSSSILAPVLQAEEQQREAAAAVQSLLVQGDKLEAFKVAMLPSVDPLLCFSSTL